MALIPRIFGQRSNVFDPFSLDVWDPFQDWTFNRDITQSSPTFRETSALVNTRIDWRETPEAHIFKADMPGLKKEEVKVEVEEGNILQISGERSKELEEMDDKWHRIERSSGKFIRRFRLPENAKMDQVKAAMENGVLTVTVPKEEVKKPEVKAIKIDAAESKIIQLKLVVRVFGDLFVVMTSCLHQPIITGHGGWLENQPILVINFRSIQTL